MENSTQKKEKTKLSPEALFDIYLECMNPQAPIKSILERHGVKPWDYAVIKKRIKEASIQALAQPNKKGRKPKTVLADLYQKNLKELQETKDALVAIGHEFSLLKKRVN